MKILAVDVGDARTGLAACDRTEFLASPIGVIHDRTLEGTVEKTAIAVTEYDIGLVVVGYPLNMNGSRGPKAEQCAQFAEALRAHVEVPVILWDERSTTVSAHQVLTENGVHGKKRKNTVDGVAAAFILEGFLAWRKNHPSEMPPEDPGKEDA